MPKQHNLYILKVQIYESLGGTEQIYFTVLQP